MRKTTFELYRIDPSDVKRSQAWFDEKVRQLSTKKITPNRVMMGDGGMNLTSTLMPGSLYYFYYDPKHKETLPYYDIFPMVFPFDKDKTSFIGLNLHYLPYRERMILFQELMKAASTPEINEIGRNIKLRYSWDLIKSFSKLRNAKPCVKRYLFTHVKSPFLFVDPFDWHTAMMLPLQRFQKASKEKVWSESRRIANV